MGEAEKQVKGSSMKYLGCATCGSTNWKILSFDIKKELFILCKKCGGQVKVDLKDGD